MFGKKRNNKEYGGLSDETARQMGFGRARAVAEARRPGSRLTADDFRCDAEQVEIDRKGRIIKSRTR